MYLINIGKRRSKTLPIFEECYFAARLGLDILGSLFHSIFFFEIEMRFEFDQRLVLEKKDLNINNIIVLYNGRGR